MLRGIIHYILILFLVCACTKATLIRDTAHIQGVAHLNRVRNGTITLQKLNEDGTRGIILGTAVTDSVGQYEMRVSKTIDPVIAILNSGTYMDEATAQDHVLNSDESYLTLLESLNADTVTIHITPYTDLAAQIALTKIQQGLKTTTAIKTIYAQIAEVVGLKGEDLRTLSPPDITLNSNLTTATLKEKNYALLIAALSQHVETRIAYGFSLKELINAFAKDYSDTTGFDGLSGTKNVPLGNSNLLRNEWEDYLGQAMVDWINSSQNVANLTLEGMSGPISSPTSPDFTGNTDFAVSVSDRVAAFTWASQSHLTYDFKLERYNNDSTVTTISESMNLTSSAQSFTELLESNYRAQLKVKSNGTTVKTESLFFPISPSPNITSITPTAGALAGGTTVTVSGTNFFSGANVKIGGVVCNAFTRLSESAFTCVTGAHSAATVDIVVTSAHNKAGTARNLYTYQPAPTVTSVGPSTGDESGGYNVRLTGTGFVSGISISFGGYNCVLATLTSSTSLDCTTSAATAGSVDVTVTNADTQTNTATGLFTYTVGVGNWTATSTLSAPSPRTSHTTVWTGSEMLIWGGLTSSGYYNDGAKYDPASDAWATMSTSAPSARAYHTAVWTGNKMIIWGGSLTSGGTITYPNDGGQYDPAGNAWSNTTISSAPTGRHAHIAVWSTTTSTMIIWGGGRATGEIYNTGANYNPVADTWVATNSTDAPSPRVYLTSIWNGSKMIVWGGDNSTYDAKNTGGIYNPVGDTWAVTSTTGAPSPRRGHSAIWSGSKMIVWGGVNYDSGQTPFDNGGVYDPSANSWTFTSTNGNPSARAYHTAVWATTATAGSKMIIWGGSSEAGDVNSGANYEPITNAWTSFTFVNSTTGLTPAPSPRDFHSAVWTGTDMLIWGGGQYQNTGALYRPVP